MIGEFIGALTFILIGVVWIMQALEDFDIWERVRGVLIGIIILLCAPLLLWLNTIDMSSTDISTVHIVSLERNSEVSGSFVLGFGTIETNTVYYAYEDLGQDSYTLRKMTSGFNSPVIIQENDEISPRFVTTTVTKCYKDIWFYDCDWDIQNKKIYVPKGTVRKEFGG